VVKIPSLSRRTETEPAGDVNRDGHVDSRDERLTDDVATGRVPRDQVDADADGDGTPDADQAAADRAATERAADRAAAERVADREEVRSADRTDDKAAVDSDGDGTPDTVADRRAETPVAPVGPRPRTSMMATVSLIVGVAAAAFVLSGALAGYGIALGAIAVVLGFVGMSATRRRHVAGKGVALLGIGIGAAALVIGILAMTGDFAWPTTDGDWAARFREWLDSQTVDRF
jgi:hypothetical protein